MQSRPTVFLRSQNRLQGNMLLEEEKALSTLHEDALAPASPLLALPEQVSSG